MLRTHFRPGRWLALPIFLFLLPNPAEAQSPLQFRVTGSTTQMFGDDYYELEPGLAFTLDLLFPGSTARMGIGVDYAEFPIFEEEEKLVSGAVDIFADMALGGGLFLELRGGYERQAWDEQHMRFHVDGLRGGGALGLRFDTGGIGALEIALYGQYFLGLTGTVNGDEAGYTESGSRAGIRVGILLPGGGR